MRFVPFLFLALPLLACKTDADCELRPAKCCDCFHGGKLVAADKSTPKPDCSDRICLEVISTHKSCQASKAVCHDGRCELSFKR